MNAILIKCKNKARNYPGIFSPEFRVEWKDTQGPPGVLMEIHLFLTSVHNLHKFELISSSSCTQNIFQIHSNWNYERERERKEICFYLFFTLSLAQQLFLCPKSNVVIKWRLKCVSSLEPSTTFLLQVLSELSSRRRISFQWNVQFLLLHIQHFE